MYEEKMQLQVAHMEGNDVSTIGNPNGRYRAIANMKTVFPLTFPNAVIFIALACI